MEVHLGVCAWGPDRVTSSLRPPPTMWPTAPSSAWGARLRVTVAYTYASPLGQQNVWLGADLLAGGHRLKCAASKLTVTGSGRRPRRRRESLDRSPGGERCADLAVGVG
ncbi:MAG: hypothetical protein QN183_10730 [Armatimonadota bacterium]|nr:hypothetical protein [Armatimonadota bacterium]MDR7485456.1 hypothetical protein [Armatimonadota bacterium]MDR7536827.1 hypothetical protein [Armatimonadota bacterium]